jgi:hypothetical protein
MVEGASQSSVFRNQKQDGNFVDEIVFYVIEKYLI